MKEGPKNSGRGLPPPDSGNARKQTFFFIGSLPLACYVAHPSKFSWSWRIQGVSGPLALASASMMKHARWQLNRPPYTIVFLRCLHFVPSARFLLLSGRSRSGVSANSQFLTSDEFKLSSSDVVPGCTTTSSEKMGNQCTLGIKTLSSTTMPASLLGCGTTGRIREVWQSAIHQRPLCS